MERLNAWNTYDLAMQNDCMDFARDYMDFLNVGKTERECVDFFVAEAEKNGFHCSIRFVIQMNGIHKACPNNATQPEFGQTLIRAAKAGVSVIYYSCQVEADSIKITSEMGDCRYAEMPEG